MGEVLYRSDTANACFVHIVRDGIDTAPLSHSSRWTGHAYVRSTEQANHNAAKDSRNNSCDHRRARCVRNAQTQRQCPDTTAVPPETQPFRRLGLCQWIACAIVVVRVQRLKRGACALSLGAGCVGTWVSGAEYAYFRKMF